MKRQATDAKAKMRQKIAHLGLRPDAAIRAMRDPLPGNSEEKDY